MNIYLAGAIGGLVGGIVFGMIMDMMKMLPMVGKLFGKETAGAGWIVHLFFSLLIGLIYVVVLHLVGLTALAPLSSGVVYGLAYGFIWWILGPLLIMPSWLGMGPQLSPEGIKKAMPSLMGHLIYGLLVGVTISFLV